MNIKNVLFMFHIPILFGHFRSYAMFTLSVLG